MSSVSAIRKTPLAGALIVSGIFLLAGTACNKKVDTEATGAATTASAPASAASTNSTAAVETPTTTTPTTTGNASDAMGNETASSATTGTSASDMSGTSQPGSDTTGSMATGPVMDTQFYTQAMTADQEEIATADLVAGKTTNADVKHLATKIASDHQALDSKIKAAAGSSVAALPVAQPDSAIKGKTGKDLDQAYASTMVSDHQKDIPVFENVAKNGSTAQARKLASEALPKLREHLKLAQDLQKKLGSG